MKRTFALVFVVVTLASGAASAVMVDREFHESFEALEGDVIECRFGDGDVRVSSWDENTVDVRVAYRADVKGLGFGRDPDFEADIRRVDGEILIEGREIPGGAPFVRVRSIDEYVYSIKAPSWVVLRLTGDDGDVTVDGRTAPIAITLDDGDVDISDSRAGEIRIAFEDGDLALTKVAAELRLTGDDGDVVLTECEFPFARLRLGDGDVLASGSAGNMEIVVDDGDVALHGMVGERLEIRGEDGDVRVELAEMPSVDLDIDLDDGDADIVYVPGLSAKLLFTTDDGRLELDGVDIADYEEDEHMASGVIGGGDGRIRIRTSDGDVLLRSRR